MARGRSVPPAVDRVVCEHKQWLLRLDDHGQEQYGCTGCPVVVLPEQHPGGWVQMHVCVPVGVALLGQVECTRVVDALWAYLGGGAPCRHAEVIPPVWPVDRVPELRHRKRVNAA